MLQATESVTKNMGTGEAVSYRRVIIALYGAAVVVRLVLAFWFGDHAPQITDAKDYDGLARRLLETGTYVSESGELISLRPPLYPLMVTGIYSIFGVGSYVAVALVQSLISLLTMAVTQWMGTCLVDRRVGFLSAAIVGFYPSLLAFNCLVLSETLFTFFFTFAVFASLRLQSQASWQWAILLGISLGLGALTRSILWVCSVPLLAYLWFTIREKFGQRCVLIGLAALSLVVVLAPWSIRNTRLHKTFTVVDVMGGRNVMMGNYEYTPLERSWATITDVTGDKSWDHVLRTSDPEARGVTQGQLDKRAMKYGIRYFFTHPKESAIRSVVRFFNFWQLERTMIAGARQGIWGDIPKFGVLALAAVICGSYVLVFFASLFGLFAAPLPWRSQGLLLLWLALPCAIHTAAFAHSRYHLPLIPILAVYAASFVTRWRNPETPMKRWALITAGAVCLLFVAGWAREIVMVDLGQF